MRKTADGWCIHCAEYGHLETHHLIPRMHGGTDDKENIVLICGPCHRRAHAGYSKPKKPAFTLDSLKSSVQSRSMVTPHQAADLLNVTPRTVTRWIANGTLPSVRIGGIRRVSAAALENVINGRAHRPRSPRSESPVSQPAISRGCSASGGNGQISAGGAASEEVRGTKDSALRAPKKTA